MEARLPPSAFDTDRHERELKRQALNTLVKEGKFLSRYPKPLDKTPSRRWAKTKINVWQNVWTPVEEDSDKRKAMHPSLKAFVGLGGAVSDAKICSLPLHTCSAALQGRSGKNKIRRCGGSQRKARTQRHKDKTPRPQVPDERMSGCSQGASDFTDSDVDGSESELLGSEDRPPKHTSQMDHTSKIDDDIVLISDTEDQPQHRDSVKCTSADEKQVAVKERSSRTDPNIVNSELNTAERVCDKPSVTPTTPSTSGRVLRQTCLTDKPSKPPSSNTKEPVFRMSADAVPECPAYLRRLAKAGDASVSIVAETKALTVK